LGTPATYTLPNAEDDEGLAVKINPSLPLPSFATYDPGTKTFSFSANKTKEVGQHVIQICVTDGYSPSNCYKLTVSVDDPNKPKKSLVTGNNKMSELAKKYNK
jgi:hypothetical protein